MVTNSDIIDLQISRGNLCRILTALVNEMFDENLDESSREMWRNIHDDLERQLDAYDEEMSEKPQELSCENCPYFWTDIDDEYPNCHYQSMGNWDPAPCEQPEKEPEDEPAFDEERW